MSGRDVFVETYMSTVNAYLETDKSSMICFRCGETGHVRYQCLTYKVRMCWNTVDGKQCTTQNCPFAHDVSELRTPWKPRCVRVVKQHGKFICIGCNSDQHTFRKCPIHKDIIFL